MGVVITKWTKAIKPIGTKGCVVGFTAISWYDMIVEGFQVINGPRGLFLEMPTQRTRAGRRLRLVRFRTVAVQEAFKAEMLAALIRAYPEDFIGFEAEPPGR